MSSITAVITITRVNTINVSCFIVVVILFYSDPFSISLYIFIKKFKLKKPKHNMNALININASLLCIISFKTNKIDAKQENKFAYISNLGIIFILYCILIVLYLILTHHKSQKDMGLIIHKDLFLL